MPVRRLRGGRGGNARRAPRRAHAPGDPRPEDTGHARRAPPGHGKQRTCSSVSVRSRKTCTFLPGKVASHHAMRWPQVGIRKTGKCPLPKGDGYLKVLERKEKNVVNLPRLSVEECDLLPSPSAHRQALRPEALGNAAVWQQGPRKRRPRAGLGSWEGRVGGRSREREPFPGHEWRAGQRRQRPRQGHGLQAGPWYLRVGRTPDQR